LLKQLTIKNYALIKHLELCPASGMTVITGETGAGKSIMLGALGLLLGNRADTKVLWEDEEKCITEGEFEISAYKLRSLFDENDVDYDDRTVIRREITSSGKSRAFINDTPVTLETMRKISSRLMDIHSQHETLELGGSAFQLELVDSFAANEKLRADYGSSWMEFKSLKEKYQRLAAEGKNLAEEADFIRFQLDELVKADLTDGELEKLESELRIQENAEDIKSRFNTIMASLGGEQSASSIIALAKINLQSVASFSQNYQQLLERLSSLKIELDDLASEIEHEESKIEFDPRKLEKANERLDLLNRLLQKHRVRSISELINIRETLQEKAGKITNLDVDLAALEKQLSDAEKKMLSKAESLSKSRSKGFGSLSKQIAQLLKELGMPDAQLKISSQEIPPGPTGIDKVEVFFSANKGISPRPLASVASGGEFSRLMFAVKYVMAERTAMPTLILDEIDTGVSGEIAIGVGRLMKEMSVKHQLISITHLPQIAAKGDAHYFVFKDNSSRKTVTTVRELGKAERIEEIAKMISGAKPTASAIENAKELISR
jgi:DNA repair protein RecN (Recombination protein N)